MIKLGDKVRDRVTGFEGIAVAKVEYLNWCVQFCVKPRQVKGKSMPEGIFIDVGQLELVGDGFWMEKRETGGSMPDTPGSSYRT